MYIPAATLINSVNATSSPKNEPVGGWSSLIGIVTAIVGNILISFALNTQRYAHMRLGKDRDTAQEKGRANREGRSNGNSQERIADERARKNAAPQEHNATHAEANGERQPLLGARTKSSSTSDTCVEAEKTGEQEQPKSYLKSPVWWLGISLMVVGEAGNFLAYGFAPASIVSPLGVVALISNCLIAPLLLHEEFRVRDGIGVIIAIAGCVIVVLSASGSNPRLSPNDIWDLITRWEFETYLGITIFLIIVLMIASNRFGDRTVLIDLGLVGLFGGYTALSTKGVASLLSNTIWRVFTFPITYLLVVVLVSTAILQIKYVNRALQRFNSTIVIPTQFVLFTISVIVGSAVLYRDFERRSAGDAGKFIGGCALTFLGVWCITSGRSNGSVDEEEEQDDHVDLEDHEAIGVEHNKSSQCRPKTGRASTVNQIPPKVLISSEAPSSVEERSIQVSKALGETAGPANRAAVRPDTAATINSIADSQPKIPKLHATTSEPVVPTLEPVEHAPTPRTPSRRRSHAPGVSPTREPGHSPAPRLLGRHSITDFMPGPLMSPLSSSLSAIVADSLRRGVDHTPASTLRTRSMRLARRRTGEDGRTPTNASKRRSIDSAELEFPLETPGPDAATESPVRPSGRDRSFSATISDIFGSALNRHRSHDAGGNARQPG